MASTGSARGGGGRISILYSFPHAFGAPGIGWTAWNQVNELVRAGHDVHLVAASISRPVPGLASVTTSLAIAGRRVPHRVMGRDRALAWHDRVAARAVLRHPLGAVQVVHVWPLAATRTIEAARRRGIPSFREVPNTHTANAYEVVARESARLGLTPRAGASHTADPRRLATEEREWATATALLVPSDAVAATFLERGYYRVASPPAPLRVHPRRAGGPPRARPTGPDRGLPRPRRTAQGPPPRPRRVDRVHRQPARDASWSSAPSTTSTGPWSPIAWRTRASSCAG